MKKIIFLTAVTAIMYFNTHAQEAYTQQMQAAVMRLDKANNTKEYQQLANDFLRIADAQKTGWLPYYYTAFCNAKIGWLKQNDDPDNIEPFVNKAEEEIKKAQSLIDTTKQKKELSELYCLLSMTNRSRVYINPQTYGPEYGPVASRYTYLAEQANPENPRAIYLEGWEKFATPKMWGGDKVKAKALLISAKEKLDNNPSPGIDAHWGKREVEEILNQLK
jgi:hypothetical protein